MILEFISSILCFRKCGCQRTSARNDLKQRHKGLKVYVNNECTTMYNLRKFYKVPRLENCLSSAKSLVWLWMITIPSKSLLTLMIDSTRMFVIVKDCKNLITFSMETPLIKTYMYILTDHCTFVRLSHSSHAKSDKCHPCIN